VDERAAPSPTTRARTKDGTNRSNAKIGQERTNASFSHYGMKTLRCLISQAFLTMIDFFFKKEIKF
jgi:hypothetical protein